jgi:hypothetical protein
VSAYACLRGVVGGTVGDSDSAADDSDRGSGAAAAAAVDYAAWNFDALGLSETPAEWSKARRDARAVFTRVPVTSGVASCSQWSGGQQPLNQPINVCATWARGSRRTNSGRATISLDVVLFDCGQLAAGQN